MLASLALDTFGWFGIAAHPFALSSSAGTATVLAGALLIVFGQPGGIAALRKNQVGWMALALLAGAVLPLQGAVNALLRHDLGGATFAVGATSFLVATIAMAAAMLLGLVLPKTTRPTLSGLPGMPWWGWLGGFAGATYVTTVFTAIPVIGAAATVGLTVAGQQIASVFVDRFGWFRLPKRPVSKLRLAGVAVLLTGVVLIKALLTWVHPTFSPGSL